MSETVDRRARIHLLASEGLDERGIAAQTGVNVRTVRATLAERPGPRERALLDAAIGWAPLCMDADEWADWRALNPPLNDFSYAARPCTDCPIGFAAEMRAEGRCNGTPGWRPPADDHEEAEVGDTVTVSNVSLVAPCGSCSHEAVCAIKASLRGLEEAEVAIPKPDPALSIGLAVTVECSHYSRIRGSGGTKGRKLANAARRAAVPA